MKSATRGWGGERLLPDFMSAPLLSLAAVWSPGLHLGVDLSHAWPPCRMLSRLSTASPNLSLSTSTITRDGRRSFDGKTLKGWDGSPEVWHVEDGALVGESSPEHPSGTTNIIWRGGQPGNFELKAEMKLEGRAPMAGSNIAASTFLRPCRRNSDSRWRRNLPSGI